jgi:hypothetical protein
MHFPSSRFYIRRVRFSNQSPLLEPIRQAGYHIEPSVIQPDTTVRIIFDRHAISKSQALLSFCVD